MVCLVVSVSLCRHFFYKLDQLRAARPVLGDEQIIDVELDRKTAFRQVQDNVNTISWNGDGDYMRNSVADNHLLSFQHAGTLNESSITG